MEAHLLGSKVRHARAGASDTTQLNWLNTQIWSQMTPTISVVVPTYNSASVIAACLQSLDRQSHTPHEVIVSDGGSSDDTAAISAEHGAILVRSRPSRSAQRNLGALRASGEYIIFVDSDMRLTPTVLHECVTAFRSSDAALVIPEVDIGESYWARVKGFERSFYQGVWWLQAARCFRRADFLEINGFDVGLIGAEDWDLDERIRHFGSVREISATIQHNEAHTTLRRLMEKKTHYAQSLTTFRTRHPERASLSLSARHRIWLIARQPWKLIAHPLLCAGLVTIGVAEILVNQGVLKHWSTTLEEQPLQASHNPLLDDDLE